MKRWVFLCWEEYIFHSLAPFFNNQREIPYLRSAMQYLLCIQHALCEYPKKYTRYASSGLLSVVITNLQSSHTTAHNLLNYFSPVVTYSLQVVFQFVQKVRENSHTLIFISSIFLNNLWFFSGPFLQNRLRAVLAIVLVCFFAFIALFMT